MDDTTGDYLDRWNVVHVDELVLPHEGERESSSVPERGNPGIPPRSTQEAPYKDHGRYGKRSAGP